MAAGPPNPFFYATDPEWKCGQRLHLFVGKLVVVNDGGCFFGAVMDHGMHFFSDAPSFLR